MDADKRGAPRQRLLRRGQIVFRNGFCVIDCVVVDLSETGARLRGAGVFAAPERFRLRIDRGAFREVEVCFRNDDILGVRFLG